jgi:isopentenyldiphosphate isomerase
MKLKKHTISKIKYTKADGSVSTRDIVPMFVPGNVSALDVSDMDDDVREMLLTRLSEYNEFTDRVKKEMMTFEQWMKTTHKKETTEKLKWRSFIPEKISDPE